MLTTTSHIPSNFVWRRIQREEARRDAGVWVGSDSYRVLGRQGSDEHTSCGGNGIPRLSHREGKTRNSKPHDVIDADDRRYRCRQLSLAVFAWGPFCAGTLGGNPHAAQRPPP